MKAELAAFTVSVLINAGLLATFDRAAIHYDHTLIDKQKKSEERTDEILNFEYIEAPPKVHAKRPARTKKSSDRDAISQDLTEDKTLAQDSPKIQTEGKADQLTQIRRAPSSSPAPSSPAVEEKASGPDSEKIQSDISEKIETAMNPMAQKPALPSTASSPTDAVDGLTGQDRINTAAVAKSQSHGAQLYGVTSFEATGSGMGVYMKNLKERIWMAWFPYLVIHYPKDFQSADVLLNITLNARGEVKIVELEQSSGSPLFAAFCMESVQRAGPYGAIPKEILALIGKDELEIKFAFHYW